MRTPRALAAPVVLVALLTSAVASTPAGADDAQAIRDLFQTHWQAHYDADLDKVLSTAAEDLVAYGSAWGRDPNLWRVTLVGREAWKAQLAGQLEAGKERWEAHPDWTRHSEVTHIDVNGENALAVTHQTWIMPNEETGQTVVNEWRSVWMLAKRKGAWKITGWLAMVDADQTIYVSGE